MNLSQRTLIVFLALSMFCADAYKFLLYAPMFGRSHVTFLGKTSEALIEAGHHVTILIPEIDSRLGTKWAKGTETIIIPQTEDGKLLEQQEESVVRNIWESASPLSMGKTFFTLRDSWFAMCREIVKDDQLLNRLKAANFDVGYGELTDACGAGLFHVLGINRTALTQSVGSFEGGYKYTGAPTFPSFVPGNMASSGSQMGFFTRMKNFVTMYGFKLILAFIASPVQALFEEKYPGFPNLHDLHARCSLVFINNDPIVDFPRPTSHKLIEIGGITVAGGHQPLNKTWSDILDLRPKTVFLSFGSVAKSYLMPPEYKNTIRETFRKFHDVTFIWKYEKPEDNIGEGIDNIIVTTWAPQNDLLRVAFDEQCKNIQIVKTKHIADDPRLSVFITHCGGGSTIESNLAGVPRIVIPVMGDQQRNAQLVIHNGVGVALDKTDIAKEGKLEEALRQVLGNPEYLHNARRIARMLEKKPFTVKETFVRNMEFLAEFGPLRYLDQHGQNQSFIQFYLIDVSVFLVCVILFVVFVTYKVVRCVFRKFRSYNSKKHDSNEKKNE